MLSRAPRQPSLGQRMRAEIMASLLHGPKLLLLDEPTVGIDFVAKSRIRALIRSLVSQENVTVILASHELTDIQEICDDAMLLHRGKIVFHGPLKSLMRQTEGYTTWSRTARLAAAHSESACQRVRSRGADQREDRRGLTAGPHRKHLNEKPVPGGRTHQVLPGTGLRVRGLGDGGQWWREPAIRLMMTWQAAGNQAQGANHGRLHTVTRSLGA